MCQHYIHVRRLPIPFPVVELNWAKVQVDLATQIGYFSSYDSVKNLVGGVNRRYQTRVNKNFGKAVWTGTSRILAHGLALQET
jgi:hypothetical protein